MRRFVDIADHHAQNKTAKHMFKKIS